MIILLFLGIIVRIGYHLYFKEGGLYSAAEYVLGNVTPLLAPTWAGGPQPPPFRPLDMAFYSHAIGESAAEESHSEHLFCRKKLTGIGKGRNFEPGSDFAFANFIDVFLKTMPISNLVSFGVALISFVWQRFWLPGSTAYHRARWSDSSRSGPPRPLPAAYEGSETSGYAINCFYPRNAPVIPMPVAGNPPNNRAGARWLGASFEPGGGLGWLVTSLFFAKKMKYEFSKEKIGLFYSDFFVSLGSLDIVQ